MRLLLAVLLLAACSVRSPNYGADAAPDVAEDVAPDAAAPADVRDSARPDVPMPVDVARDDIPTPDVALEAGAPDVAPPCVDRDGDRFGEGCANGPDCNDDDPTINPGRADERCNGIDENCDGVVDTDNSPSLTDWCRRTAPPDVTFNAVMPTCNYPGRAPPTMWPPVSAVTCFGVRAADTHVYYWCWRTASDARLCPGT